MEGSYSRKLADFFERKWLEVNPEGQVLHRSLSEDNIPHIRAETIQGFYVPKDQMSQQLTEATKLSDLLINELKSADDLLISSPLYNLNVPSNLKAYIDQVVRIGETFGTDENGYHGLLSDIQAYIITVKGGVIKGTKFEELDFLAPYLKAVLSFIGIHTKELFSLEGTAQEQVLADNFKEVQAAITEHFISN